MMLIRYSFLILLSFMMSSCNSQSKSSELAPKEFEEKIKSSPDAILLDVRTPEEYASGFIKNAINLDYNNEDFTSKIKTLDKSKTYLVYCLSGGRSGEAVKLMSSNGFTKVINLKGGILAWKKENLSLSNTPAAMPISGGDNSIEQFQSLISKNKKVLIDFYAPWCGPCKRMAPILEALKSEYAPDIKIVKINIDENEALAASLGISQIPLFHYYIDGKLVWQQEGMMTKKEFIAVFNK